MLNGISYYRNRISETAALCISVLLSLAEAFAYARFKPAAFDISRYEGVIIPSCIDDCLPEPYEFLIFVIILITFPIAFLVCKEFTAFLLSRVELKNAEKLSFSVQTAAFFALSALIIAGIFLAFDSYVAVAAAMLISAVITVPLVLIKKNCKENTRKILFSFGALCVIAFFSYFAAHINFSLTDYFYVDHHVYAVWYPVYKVASGQTIGIDFECIYGFYAYIIVPLIRLFTQVNLNSFSVFVAVILSINAGSYYLFSYRFIDNKFVAFICATLASLYGPFMFFTSDVYFQYFPLRSFFVSLVLICICIYQRIKKHRIPFLCFVTLLMAAAILWNIETGLVACVIWAGFIIYRNVYIYGFKSKKIIKPIISAAVSSVFSVILFVLTVEAITYFRSGELLSTESMLFGIRAFAGTGFYMLPIEYGPWILLIALIVFGLFISLSKTGMNAQTESDGQFKNEALFAVSIAAAGSFSYYIGRSYITNAFVIAPYCLIICGMLIDVFKNRIRRGEKSFKEKFSSFCSCVKVFLCCVFVVMTAFQTAYNFRKPILYACSLVTPKAAISGAQAAINQYGTFISTEDDSESPMAKASQVIKVWSDKYNNGETPHLLITYSAYIEEMLNTPSADKKCETIDCFYYDNVKTYIDFLNGHKGESFVLDNNVAQMLRECYPAEYEAIIKEYRLAEKYNTSSISYYLYLLK